MEQQKQYIDSKLKAFDELPSPDGSGYPDYVKSFIQSLLQEVFECVPEKMESFEGIELATAPVRESILSNRAFNDAIDTFYKNLKEKI